MARYLLKRLLLMVPTLVLISLLTFFISTQTPGDPVALQWQQDESNFRQWQQSEAQYRQRRAALGLDKPLFYFSFSRLSMPDTLYRIASPIQRRWLRQRVHQTGHWPSVEQLYHQLRQLEAASYQPPSTYFDAQALIDIRQGLNDLYRTDDQEAARQAWVDISHSIDTARGLAFLQAPAQSVELAWTRVEAAAQPWRSYVPALHWHGWDNQYHRWLFGGGGQRGLLQGYLGRSYRNQRAVTAELGTAIGTTLQLSLIAIVLAYLIAIPLGVFSAARRNSRWDKGIQTSLFVLYSLPAFWIGTLLIVFLGGGDFLNWFPPYGLGNTRGLSGWEAFWVRAHHLVLPIVCLVYPTLAFLSRQARGGMVQSLHEDYIRTARAKGLGESRVIWWHGFRNALLSIITLFANVFPYAIAGSVIVEVVFSIPGMGKMTLDALYARDYPIVYGVVIVTAVLTLIGYWVSDALYSLADPRIRFKPGHR